MESIEIPSFRVKRSHKKSRNGCNTCKKRRVKCDETRPECVACSRRGIQCIYGDSTNRNKTPNTPESMENRASSTGESPVSATASSPPGVTPPVLPDAIPALETDLVYHYLTHTVMLFSARDEWPTMWATILPASAYNAQSVRNGMLTLAALCMHKHAATEEKIHYLDVAEYYGEQFVMQSSQQLRELKPADSDCNLACARLLNVLALGFFRIRQHYNLISISDPEAWTWLHMMRGAWTVHQHYARTSYTAHKSLLYEADVETSSVSDGCQDYLIPPPYTNHPHYNFLRSSRWERMAALRVATSGLAFPEDPQRALDISTAIDMLEEITHTICAGEARMLTRTLCAWPRGIPLRFVEALMAGDLIALVIHAHWLMLVVLAEDMWWVDDMATSGIRDIIAMCETEPENGVVRSLLRWPAIILEDRNELQ